MRRKKTASSKASQDSLLSTSAMQDERFWKGFRISAGAHALVVIAAVVVSLVAVDEPVKLVPSIRVDIVGLPDIKKSELNKLTPSDMSDLSKKTEEPKKSEKDTAPKVQEPKKVEKPKPDPDAMALKKKKSHDKARKDALKSALDRIKALTDIEAEVKKNQKPQKAAAKGNMLSSGNSLTGATGQDINAYASLVADKLRANWNLPIWLSKQKLNAKVVIFLDRAGYVSNAVVAQSSGNSQFDDYCLKTVRMAQPFGTPPEEVLGGGITLGFPL